MNDGGFYRSAEWYDAGYGWVTDDVEFWIGLAERWEARRLLELGCGTGRVTVPLARWAASRDAEVVGLDLLPEMLASARTKLEHEPAVVMVAARLVQGDMRAFELDNGPFDLICVPFNTLGHLHTIEEQLDCLTSARRHLRPGGRCAVDVVCPTVDELHAATREAGSAEIDGVLTDPETGAQVVRYRRTRYYPETQTLESHFTDERMDAGGASVAARTTLSLHLYFPRELELLFRLAGFSVEAVYGDYGQGPLTAASVQTIVVGRVDE